MRKLYCTTASFFQSSNHKLVAKKTSAKISEKIKKGDILFQEGERLNGTFCVNSGVSKLFQMSENGKDQIVKIAGKGEILRQYSVITEENTSFECSSIK